MCPLSNLALNHIKHIKQLKIDELLDAEVWLTLNPDDDLFLPDMKKVVEECTFWYCFRRKHCAQLEANAIRPL